MQIKDLLGMKVLDTDAKEIGKISNADFDSETGQIEKLTVSLQKNFFSNDDVVVRYDNIKSIGDYVLLDIDVVKE